MIVHFLYFSGYINYAFLYICQHKLCVPLYLSQKWIPKIFPKYMDQMQVLQSSAQWKAISRRIEKDPHQYICEFITFSWKFYSYEEVSLGNLGICCFFTQSTFYNHGVIGHSGAAVGVEWSTMHLWLITTAAALDTN